VLWRCSQKIENKKKRSKSKNGWLVAQTIIINNNNNNRIWGGELIYTWQLGTLRREKQKKIFLTSIFLSLKLK
jgi:hypothetical protein